MSENNDQTPDELSGNGHGEVELDGSGFGVSGDEAVDDRIEQLDTALEKAKQAFIANQKSIWDRVCLWIGVCVVMIIVCAITLSHFIGDKPLDSWTWQIIYYTAIRVLTISALFYVASFAFKSLKSELILFNENKRKMAILSSMASFVESGAELSVRKQIYSKLIEIIVGQTQVEINSTSDNITDNDKDTKLKSIIIEAVTKAIK